MRFFSSPVFGIRFFSALLIVAALSSCSPAEKPETVVVGATISLLNSLIWIAQDNGYFKEQGLEVRFKQYPSGKRALDGMLAGESDVSTTAEVPFISMLAENPDLRLIATLGSSDDELKIVTRTDRGIEKPADLKGKIIATQKASSVHFFLHLFLLQHYISEQDVTVQFMKAEELPTALAEGKIDAFSMREPFISQAKKLLSENINIFSEPALYRKTYNLVSKKSYIEKNPEIIKKLLKALIQAEQFTENKPDKAIMIMAERLRTDIGTVSQLWDNFFLRVVLEQDLLLQLQQQQKWSKQFSSQNDFSSLSILQSLHIESLKQIAPDRVGLNSVGYQ